MIDIIYSFATGISFAFGVLVGAYLGSIATRKGRDDLREHMREHNARVEDRLAKYVVNSARIATALESATLSRGDGSAHPESRRDEAK